MTLAADRLWSAEQQAWLGALGHVLYLPADWPTEAGPAAAAVPEAAREPAPASAQAPAHAPARAARPPRESMEAPDRTPRQAPPARGGVSARPLPDRLHFALIRASGCNPNAPGAAELFAQWPPSAELRGNPAAKRALWPALRRLRRTGAP